MIREVLDHYRSAVAMFAPLLTIHVFLRLVFLALILPLIGLLLALTLQFSDQTALTDQDIARFLLTPAGALGALVIGSALVAALILDVAVMTATLRSRRTNALGALREGIGFTLSKGLVLVQVAGGLLLRVLLLSLPFLVVGGGLFLTQLTEFDINYYLTERPPEFTRTVVMIGGVLGLLALLLLERLTGWALVLDMVLFDRQPIGTAFRDSRRLMAGHKLALLRSVALWLGLRLAVAAGISAGLALGLQLTSGAFRQDLTTAALAVMGVMVLALLATTVLNAASNGALAALLNDLFERAGGGTEHSLGPQEADEGPLGGKVVAGLAVAGVVAVGVIGGAAALSEGIRAETEVAVIGHRGAAGARPENTMASVLKAIEDGADWVEIDVQETSDGAIVVAHDSDFMKAAGNPIKVWDATLADLAEVDIGSWYDPAYAGERVPLLRDVLLEAKDRARVIIELKYYGHDVDLENRVISIVEETDMADQVATMSLSYPAVQKMRDLRPDWRTGVLAATALGDLSGLEGDFLAVSVATASPGLVARAEDAGKQVYAWTVNDALSMSRMISMGVHGLITDEPALARQVIAEHAELPAIARLALWVSESFGVALDRLTGVEVTQ